MKGFKKNGKFIPTERNSKNSLTKKSLDKKTLSSPSGKGHEMRDKKTIQTVPDFIDLQEGIGWVQKYGGVEIRADERAWTLYFNDGSDSGTGIKNDERLLDHINDIKNRVIEEGNYQPNIGKQKLDLIPPQTATWQNQTDSFGRFDLMSPEVAKKLLTGHPNIDPNESQNDSPSAKEMVALAKKYGGHVGGYYVGEADVGRDDHRITLETLVIPVDEETANTLAEHYHPDELDLQEEGSPYGAGYRFWWD